LLGAEPRRSQVDEYCIVVSLDECATPAAGKNQPLSRPRRAAAGRHPRDESPAPEQAPAGARRKGAEEAGRPGGSKRQRGSDLDSAVARRAREAARAAARAAARPGAAAAAAVGAVSSKLVRSAFEEDCSPWEALLSVCAMTPRADEGKAAASGS